jgi:outer membrane protein assembly factor BamA
MKRTTKLRLSGASVLFSLLLCLLFTNVSAQFSLRVQPIDKDSAFVHSLKLQSSFRSKDQLNKYLDQLPGILQSKGYATSSIDSIILDSNNASINVYFGNEYRWDSLRIGEEDRKVLESLLLTSEKRPLSLNQYENFQQRMLEYLGNRGYPFAKVYIDSIEITSSHHLKGVLKIDKGPLYKIDSMRVYGNVRISNQFLQQYLELPNGCIYQTEKLQRISNRIRELPYLQEQQPWNLTMLGTGSVVNLYLQEKKSSQVNVLIGLLPSNQQTGKLLVTGEANINLKNALGGGETLGLNWQQLQPKSPRLNLLYIQPFMFRSPFGMNAAFDLYKRDSSFVNINMILGAQYMVSSFQSASIFFQSQRTNVLTVDTNEVFVTKQLPDLADVSSLNIGVSYNLNRTDYRFNPRKGTETMMNVAIGTRKLKESEVIMNMHDPNNPTFEYASLYDSVKTKSYQIRIRADAAHYFPLSRTSTFKVAAQFGLFHSQTIFRNELFQIGGYKLLRGFDEESIFASQFLVLTGEYRFLIGQNSFLFSFVDFGSIRNAQPQPDIKNQFFGTGLGIAFETKAGVFNISYAVGKRNDTQLDLRQSKIHLGFVTFF